MLRVYAACLCCVSMLRVFMLRVCAACCAACLCCVSVLRVCAACLCCVCLSIGDRCLMIYVCLSFVVCYDLYVVVLCLDIVLVLN